MASSAMVESYSITQSYTLDPPDWQASIAQTASSAGASCEPTLGFRAAIARLTDEHVRELSALHDEIAKLQKMVANSTTLGSSEEDFCLDCLPEPPKQSLRPAFAHNVNDRLADRLSDDDPAISRTSQSDMPKDEAIRNSASYHTTLAGMRQYLGHQESERQEQAGALGIHQLGSEVASKASHVPGDGSIVVPRDGSIISMLPALDDAIDDGMPQTMTLSDPGEITAFAARALWTTEGPSRQQMRSLNSARYSFTARESIGSSNHSFFPTRLTDRCIISPTSSRHASWVSFTTMALAYDLYFIPLTLGFDLAPSAVTDVGNWITRWVWTIDIPLSFCTAYFLPDNESLETSHIRIALRYMKSWFLLDVCLVFVDWYMSMSGGDHKVSRVGRLGKFARFLRFLRMLRLLRAARVGSFIERLLESIVDEASRLRFITLKIILMMLWLNHFLACSWYYVGSYEVNGHPGWTLRSSAITSFFESYSSSMQWALANFGVGSSRLYPETSAENSFAFFTMLFSLLIFATLLSTIANGYARMQAVRSEEITNMSQLRIYLAQNNVSSDLCGRIIRQAKTTVKLHRSKLRSQSVVLLQFLSPRMNAELKFAVYSKHIELSSLFNGLLKMNKDLMFTLSNEAMRDVHSPGGDVLFYRGQTASHMLLLPLDGFHGTLKYIGTYQARYISPGRWICEACLWMPWIHLGSLKVSEACEQVQMNSEKFGRVIYEHPEYYKSVRDVALFFVSSINGTLQVEDVDQRRDTLELYDTHAHIDWKGYLPGFVERHAVQLHRVSGRSRRSGARASTFIQEAQQNRKSWFSPILVVRGVHSEVIQRATTMSRTMSSFGNLWRGDSGSR